MSTPQLDLNLTALSLINIISKDPKKYGVIVKSGERRGLLLPDLEGVDTVDEQISIASMKAVMCCDSP